MAETETEIESFDDNDMDALDLIQCDAYEREVNAEATAKAFGALGKLTEVLAEVRDGKRAIIAPDVFVEQLKRLARIAEDYYAARGDA